MYLLIKNYPWYKSCVRLATSVVYRSFNGNSSQNLNSNQNKIRNIGLVAHIDAGKTTTTERMLYYSGSSEHIGEVHHGDTIMDFMEQERERGITITMAAATIEWKKFQINLIDTPGHVDFTFEVERSLSALDGTVVILDATAGVQAQTIKVWQQARKYQIPSLFYLNKMDKQSPSLEKCLTSIERKLGVQPVLLQIPVFQNSLFTGLIDLVNGTYFQWPLDYKQRNVIDQIPSQQLLLMDSNSEKLLHPDLEHQYKTELKLERENLIGKLCDIDEQFANYALTLSDISQIEPYRLIKSIRSACLQGSLFPVLLGSSYRNIGVQPLLDSICLYLPDPLEQIQSKLIFEHYSKNSDHPNASENLSALAFKIHYHKRLGSLTYLRLYSGSITPGIALFNLNRNSKEKITKIYKPFADNFIELKDGRVNFGDICVVSGLSTTITGDTLVHFSYENNSNSINKTPFLAGIEIPEPVYYCSLECSSISKMKDLEVALEHLTKEDPSFKVIDDQKNQQLVIKGMGELHIEIIKDRIKREYGIEVETGPLQVSYKETILSSAHATLEQSKTIGSTLNYVNISLQVKPKSGSTIHLDDNLFIEKDCQEFKKAKKMDISSLVKIVNTKDHNLKNELTPWQLKAIYTGVSKVFENGPLYSFPVMEVEVFIHQFETTNKTLPAFMSSITSQCLNMALKKSRPILMEPIMKVEIVTPNQFLGTIISDLARRRSQLATSEKELDTNESTWKDEYTERHILAYVPLAEMFNYSTDLRTISSGMASFDFSIHSYKTMDENQTEQVIRKISGID